MRRQRERDTAPEIALRKELWRRGLRYRLHMRPVPGLRRLADIVFPSSHVAVFVDGCFWHGCPKHGTKPKSNISFWAEKLRMNIERDKDTNRILRRSGWTVIRVWEHEDPVTAARRIERVVRSGGRHLSRGNEKG